MSKTMMEGLQAYLEQYPALVGQKLRVDFLTPETDSYSVDAVPCKETVRAYLGGAAQKQYLFVLATRTYFGPHIRQQLDNLGFFEHFATWLKAQQKAKHFPDFGASRRVQKLEVLSSGYAFAPGVDSARYQMQCRVVYFEKG